MLTSVDVSNVQGAFVNFPIQDSSSTGIVVKNIDGLDPVKATLVTSSFANQDGAQYHSSRRDTRNIVITLGLDPLFTPMTVQELRRKLYSVFMPKTDVSLMFHSTDLVPVQATGHVESLETPLFAQEPEVQVSIICTDPDFIDPVPTIISGDTTAGTPETLIHYEGTVDTGVLIGYYAHSVTSLGQTIYNRDPNGSVQEMALNRYMDANGKIAISTVPGNKYAQYIDPAGALSSALQNVAPYSGWMTLYPGDNYFQLYTTTTATISWTLQYMTRYGGL